MPVQWDEAGIEECKQLAGRFIDEKATEIGAASEPPVDTGFLRASVYVYSSRVNMFDQTWESDYYMSTKGYGLVPRERVDSPEQPADQYGAVVGWAAVYAWWVEDMQSFIYPALLSVAGGDTESAGGMGAVQGPATEAPFSIEG
jgi:hypothetical protein